MDRPTCFHCGKPLRACSGTEFFGHNDAFTDVDAACRARNLDRKAVTKVSWETEYRMEEMEMGYGAQKETRTVINGSMPTGRKIIRYITYRTGRYGCYGDGLFCKAGCGYQWACRELRGENR